MYPFLLHSYCLMTNHYHLQIETSDIEIWHIMRRLNKLYTSNFNSKYGLVGHLFQGRYFSVLNKNDATFLHTSRYIHLNPVKANIVKQAANYPWSSYSAYLKERVDELLTVEKVLGYFQSSNHLLYQRYVEQVLEEDFQENEISETLDKTHP